ncbi:hypothetical protein QLQ85_19840 [Halomonas sp. M4R5S39]|uniref:Flp family type IVb pilin n=1 Tax=Halomonas kalidii TaxID=3043293 RepID=UPI0024A90497|nr:hypothetical protein [Halomonas kalidii]MDI5987042.1 hypothetical protein [Halomonas kalidii]
MSKLMQGIERFWREEEGAETVEWILVCGLMVAVFVVAYTALSPQIEAVFTAIANVLQGTAGDIGGGGA